MEMTGIRALILLLALHPIAALASETSVLEQRARDFYVAWVSGDLVAASRLWISTKRESFLARASRTAATRCQQLHKLRIVDVAVEGDTAAVDFDVRLTRWSAMPGSAIDAHHGRETLTFRNERGDWKVTGWRTPEEELADRVLTARNPDALLRERADLRNRRLVDALCKRVVTLGNRQENSRAETILALAEAIANESDDAAARANTMSTESILLRTAHRDLAGSVRAAEEAVAWAERSGDPDVLAQTLMRLGRAQYEARSGDAATTLDRVLGLADFVEDASVLAHAASQRARISDFEGELRDGLRFTRLAASYAAMSGDPAASLNALLNLVGSYAHRGDTQQALAHAQTALAMAEREGFAEVQATILGEIANCERGLGRPEQFLHLTGRALELLGEQGDADARVDLHAKRAAYWLDHGDVVAAEAEIERGERALAELPDSDSARSFIAIWLRLRIQQGRYDDAGRIAERVSSDWRMLGLRAEILEAQGRDDEARCLLEKAID
jgi:tetratricopeptide (TPR) repeat protein